MPSIRRTITIIHTYDVAPGLWPRPTGLNASELTVLLGWPIGGPDLPGLSYLASRTLPAPAGALAPLGSWLPQDKRSYGLSTYPSPSPSGPAGPDQLVVQGVQAILSHRHVLGPTGTGKSTLLARLILEDIAAGQGLVVIEPKGDLITDVLERFPPERRGDLILIEPTADPDLPSVGVNVLRAGPEERELVVDQLIHVLRSLFASSWGPRTQDVLTAALLTLLRAEGHSGIRRTLVDLPLLLTNPGFRAPLVSDPTIADPLVLGPFWSWYDGLSDPARAEVIGPVLNKLRAFLYRDSVRRLVGQAHGVDLSAAFRPDRPAVVLVNLSRGRLGSEAADLIGSLLVSTIWRLTQARATVPPERRRPVGLYLDEFQDFLRLPTDLGEVLAQARGLGLGLTLAHQHLGQLAPELRAAVLANARTKLVFGLSEADAKVIAPVLGGGLEPSDLSGLPPRHAYLALAGSGAVAPPASLRTLPLPPATHGPDRGAARRTALATHGRSPQEVDQEIATRAKPPIPAVAPDSSAAGLAVGRRTRRRPSHPAAPGEPPAGGLAS